MKLCIASNNKHKIEEISALTQHLGIDFLSLETIACLEELPETKETVAENSLQKAEYVWQNYHISCFADDTGLEVKALNGQPGVKSGRYAGEPRSDARNVTKLLEELNEKSNRNARFKTVISLFLHGNIHQFEGIVEGTILKELKGEKGFGYDPVFQPKGFQKTFAEMSLEEKSGISHRGIAMRKLIDFLENYQKTVIYHIVLPHYWKQFEKENYYQAPTFEEEGFIHLSTKTQVESTLNRYYKGQKEVLLLHILPTKLEAELKYEPATNGLYFPHLYGKLNKSAVVKEEILRSEFDGFSY